jgi:hypothetical protein
MMSNVRQKRAQTLLGIERKYGEFLDLILAKAELESQHDRSAAVLTRQIGDRGALRVLKKALAEEWRNNHILQFHLAEYQRYIWDLGDAVAGFRAVAASATNGDLRREAEVALARALYTAAVYSKHQSDETREAELREAHRVAEGLMGAFDHADDIAVLKDRIALELGEKVDWSTLDEIHGRVVGCCIGSYPSTLFSEYDTLKVVSPEAPHDTADLLRRNFANPEVLGLTGSLYLRRAEKGAGNDVPKYYQSATALFIAQSLLERSWEGKERPLTSFRIARAIVSAAQEFRDLNPIAGLSLLGKPSQLALAISLLQSAIDRSVGGFRDMLMDWQHRARCLRSELGESA